MDRDVSLGRLNPFEFRAGIYFGVLKESMMRFVLIPLNSGLVFTSQNNLEVAAALVLIPLNSGLVFT